MSRPLHARKPKGSTKNNTLCDKDDANANKQQVQKADLLARMRDRINDAPKAG
ncbi:hypothetical protein ABZY02_19090 [Streptomyces sp. NPDC006649]|uniref:hypothetical protein n=1 Tax=unclassified Streptomyces TaxID=2593676 RepID=UPI0033A025D5